MLAIVATKHYIPEQVFKRLASSIRRQRIYDNFDPELYLGRVLYSFVREGNLYVAANITPKEGKFLVPGYKESECIVTWFGYVDFPADHTLVELNKNIKSIGL